MEGKKIKLLKLLFVFLLLFSSDLRSEEGSLDKPENLWESEEKQKLRYPNEILFFRFFHSVEDVSLSMKDWDQGDWFYFNLFAFPTLYFMAPTGPSPDVQFQGWVQESRTEKLDNLFPHISSWNMFFGTGIFTGAVWSYGLLAEDSEVLEYGSLMLEALATTQLIHAFFKMSLGREGPGNGNGKGILKGPIESWSLFPAGTPSGHTATAYCLMGVAMEY